MELKAKSIRPFVGAKDFEMSRSFYRDLGFAENELGPQLSFFHTGAMGFYLQNGYVQDWIDNLMVFLEVEDTPRFWEELLILNLPAKYPGVRYTPIREMPWGRECFVHDPSGVLWHFGEFYK